MAMLISAKPLTLTFSESRKEGEAWHTDSIELMIRSGQKVFAFLFKGVRCDVGTFESLAKADMLEESGRLLIP